MILPQEHLPMLITPSMNDNHFEELLLINRIHASALEKKTDEVGALLQELYEHTLQHFAHEEEMMQEKKFPPYPAHKQEHDEAKHRLVSTLTDFSLSENFDNVIAYLERDLIPWFLTHVETMDRVTSMFLENSEEHMPHWERLVPRNKD